MTGLPSPHLTAMRHIRDGRCRLAFLNDEKPALWPHELDSVNTSHFSYSGGSRGSYVSLFCSAVRKADLILYGHVAFAPLRLLQTALNPKAKSLLMQPKLRSFQTPETDDYSSAIDNGQGSA
jgi:hypothetical protein